MLVKEKGKTFPERITTKNKDPRWLCCRGFLKGGYIAVVFVSTQQSYAEVVVLCSGLLDGGINRLNNAHI